MNGMIQFQDDLARRMLAMSSFRRLFADEPAARLGRCKQGRRRTRRAAEAALVAEGYTPAQAEMIRRDAEDYARLLYLSEAA